MFTRRAERYNNNSSSEAEPSASMNFGETELPFAADDFERKGFPAQRPEETSEEYAERGMRADERIFMVGLLRAEADGQDGAREAFTASDYRVRRTQRFAFMDAVGKMSAEDYAARVNNILGVISEDSRERAMAIADFYWDAGKRRAEMADEQGSIEENVAIEAPVKRTHHEKPREFDWQATERPMSGEIRTPQAEMMMENPQKYYRKQKQERRINVLLRKAKSAFDKFKADRVARRTERNDDAYEDADVPTPQVDLVLNRGLEDDGSIDVTRPMRRFETRSMPKPTRRFEDRPVAKVDQKIEEKPTASGATGAFEGTNFYDEKPAGYYFGNNETVVEEAPRPESTEQRRKWRESDFAGARFDDLYEFSDGGAF